MLEIREYVDISKYSTLQIGGQFRYFVEVKDKEELPNVYLMAQNRDVPVFILGGGSNIVFSDGVLNVLAMKMEILGFEILNETNEYTEIKVGAGENWDKFVEKTVDMNLAGLESLSAIPGTVGATPVQNVGAYGAEVKNTIVSVEVFDTKENKMTSLSNADCKFGYRDSIFKNEAKGRYVITAVTFRLQKSQGKQLLSHDSHSGLEVESNLFVAHVAESNVFPSISLQQKRQEIIETRWKKLPHPEELPNVGSFFKNPILENSIAEKIQKEYPEAKFYPVDEKLTKIPAGWLIENAGLKGKSFGKVSVYDKNALVLVNNGDATKDDLMYAKNEIIKAVFQKFGITLEQEPEII